MRWPARRILRWLLALLAVVFAVLAAGIAWLVTTEAGLAATIAALESQDAVRIRVEDAVGRLIGPLRIAGLDIEHARATIRITGFEADYEPLEILGGRISAEGVRIAEASLRLRPREGPSRPPSFMPGWLTVVVDEASVGRLLVVSPGGTELRLSDIRGSAKLTKTEIEFDGVHVDAPAWAIAGASGSLVARSPLAMNVNSAWSLTSERRIGGIVHAVGDLDRLIVDARVAAPGIARLTADMRDLTGAMRWTGKAGIAKLDLEQWVANPPVGPLRGSLSLQGDRSRYTATGVVRGAGLPESGLRVQGGAQYADGVVSVPGLTLLADSMAVRVQGALAVAETPAYDMKATWSGFRWPLAGRAVLVSARGSLEARGWREFSYRVDGEFEPAGAPQFAGNATGRFTTEQIVVEESAWNVLGGRVALHGSLARDDTRAWTVGGSARDIDPSKFRENLPGRLAFDFSGSGVGFDKDSDWSGSIRKLGGQFRGQPVSGGGGIRRDDERTEFEDIALALGPARLSLDGRLGRGANLDARLVADDLSSFHPELGGEVDATVHVRDRTVAIAFTGHDLAWQSHRAVVLSIDASIDRDGLEHSWLRLRSNGLTIAGFPLTDTRLALDGLPKDHELEFRVGAGADAVMLRGQGSWVDERFTLALDRIDASGPRVVPWRLESPTRLSASMSEAGLDPTCLVYETRRFCFEGRWQRDDGWSAKAATESFPLEALDTQVPGKPRYRGLLVADARASGRAGEPWTADVRAEIRSAAFLYKSASGADRTVELGLTRLTLQSDAERHRLDLRVSDAADIDFTVALVASRIAEKSLGELPVNGTVKGSTRLIGLLPLLVDAVDNAAGEVALDFSVAGRIGAPLLEGEARLTQGSLDFYQANLRLRELRSTIQLRENSLTLKAQGKAGEGSLDIDGRLGWRNRRLNGELTLTGDNLLVADVPEARVLASPDLKFALDGRHMNVSGSVVIPQARIAPADTAGAVLVSTDERIVRPETLPGADEPFEVTTDVRVTLGKEVRISAYGLRGTVTGAVHTRTAPREASVASGELEVIDGVYRAYGRELEVERGRLLFTGGPVTDPGVDLRATRELPGYKVGVIARGPLRRPQLTLFSEPSLPQEQIASMLIVGRSSIQSGIGESDDSVGMSERGGAMLAGQLGKYVGLDDVGLTQDPGADTELVLGKYLSPRLYVSYGISLVDEINTLKLRYTIGDRWVIAVESGNESAGDIEYRIED
ncbi:MAG TPA: translocation/assembly module TamB domain-containing protein [Steroidobacteraceae bacterium]